MVGNKKISMFESFPDILVFNSRNVWNLVAKQQTILVISSLNLLACESNKVRNYQFSICIYQIRAKPQFDQNNFFVARAVFY